MPFQAQKARISSALEQRFFGYILKKPSNWPEDQHRIDRLSRALAAYTVVALANIPDDIATNSVIDGENDGGLDAIYYDRKSARLIIVQSKFKENENKAVPNQAETLKVINGVKKLIAKDVSGFNQEFKNKFDEFEEALDTPGVTVHVVLTCLGEALDQHAKDDLQNSGLSWELFTRTKLCQALDAEQDITPVSVTLSLENCLTINAPRKAIYGQVKAKALAELVQTHDKKLFQKNIRHYLGSVAVNTSIVKTVRSDPADFFYLNNGITALATAITPAPNGKTFQLEAFSIVNGAQTAGSITGCDDISDDALVMITIIEVNPNNDDMSLKITKARNYQNAVRGIDFAGLDAQQERLRKELASIGITYHYRPSAEARTINANSIKIEEAALSLACTTFPFYSAQHIASQQPKRDNGVDYVVIAKKEMGRIWEVEGGFYSKFFTSNLSGIRLARIVNIFRFVDEILAASERASPKYNTKMLYRHGRYFIIAAIAHQFPDLFQKAEPHLSESKDGIEGDKAKLSRMVDEIVGVIAVLSTPLLAEAGYLSIFRNTGKCQELANNLLAYLPAKNILPSEAVENQHNSTTVPLPAADESAIG